MIKQREHLLKRKVKYNKKMLQIWLITVRIKIISWVTVKVVNCLLQNEGYQLDFCKKG